MICLEFVQRVSHIINEKVKEELLLNTVELPLLLYKGHSLTMSCGTLLLISAYNFEPNMRLILAGLSWPQGRVPR